ncbi:MAG TPA: M56 family metallopeptidase [Pyrinomonadaceae bacterium]|jgi:beta-lactamase regulating signal transducer with metallopeptidase domain/peptidoglycan/xylan/chitin deacetylase (PgdA/CDA1 family)
MRSIETLLAQPFIQALGWTLIHFIWQGALIAILFAGVRSLFKHQAASIRYSLACGAMLLLLLLPLATISIINVSTAETNAAPHGHRSAVQLARPPDKLLDLMDVELITSVEDASDEAMTTIPAPLGHWALKSFSAVLPWLVCGWLMGALFLSLRFIGGWVVAQRLKRRQTHRLSRRWQDAATRLSQRLRLSKPVRLCESSLVEVPTVIGWLRPVVLVPASLLIGLPAQQVEALLAHELAHIRRHDYLFNLLQTIVETLLFYHPAVWWVSRQVRVEREHCCDDLAVQACGDVLVYARALTELEQMRVRASGQLALAANGGSLLERIRRLVATTPPAASPKSSSLLAGVMALFAVCGILAGAQSTLLSAQTASVAGNSHSGAGSGGRQAALTIMSVPSIRVWRKDAASLEDITKKTLKSITANNIPAVGFVGEGVLTQGVERQARINLLKMWLDAGLELGNQTYRHISLYNTPLKDYEANVLNGERVMRPLMKERGMQLRYFSYPFLNTGPNPETKAAFERFLAKHDYQLTPVTIDSMDWLFGQVYDDAQRRGDALTQRRVAAEYVPYMERMLEFYEQLSVDVVGYEVPQVLMLTASPLLAEQMDDMIAMIKRRGYSFITLEQALQDKAYRQPDSYTGPVGISWLQRWAITKGMGFRKEPLLPTFMQQFDKRSASGSDFKSE